jgi:methyl-accepting chemotaxis protein
VVLTFGQLTPPAFLGTPEQITEQAKQISHVPTQTVARLVLTRMGMDQLIEVLRQTVENYDRAQQMAQQIKKGRGDEG